MCRLAHVTAGLWGCVGWRSLPELYYWRRELLKLLCLANKLCTKRGGICATFYRMMRASLWFVVWTRMKKGLRFSEGLCIHDGGDEGDRTPDLLTASQALSQLSYAPVRRSTIRELPRRCKDNLGKIFRRRGRGCGTGSGARGPRRPIRPAGRAPRASATPPPHYSLK